MMFLFKPVSIFKKWQLTPIVMLWFLLALIAVIAEAAKGELNNYLIFKNVFWHTWQGQDLYAAYPNQYEDLNHYGPLFSMLIAPFALLPDFVGVILWSLLNAWALYFAISQLNISERNKQLIYLITAVELMTAIHNLQFNPMLTAFLILAFVNVEKGKDVHATFFIAAGFLIKLYGIAGLLFFVFSKRKTVFVFSFISWMIVLFCLPMLISSPQFIVDSYHSWYVSLVEKNAKNLDPIASGGMQDISVMGMIRRISHYYSLPNFWVMIPAAIAVALPLLRFKQYASEKFRMFYLCIVLISVVIFSSSAESATYVIAVAGVALWYVIERGNNSLRNNILLILLFVLTIFSATDLCPYYIKVQIIRAFSLKALPCLLAWFLLIYNVSTLDFSENNKPKLS
jgi:hypothetical protein